MNGHKFTLPAGFEIELAAGPPLVDRPITAAFDDEGRLYVADSSGSNDKIDQQLAEKPHRIVRLEDTDGDGRFDRITVFADKLMFPEGTLWFDGSLYVAAPPSIWKLTDTDDDGVSDDRVEWFQGKTLTGCANDLHGPYLGPDGWIYWCKGAFAKQTYERVAKSLKIIPGPDAEPTKPLSDDVARGGLPSERVWSTRAAHIFRCRPDGSGLEPVMTGGMDNPVDVVFTPGGERIFTTTFLVQPGAGLRDGLIHAVYGGINGKDHDPIHEPSHQWTGPSLMPVLSHLGAAAPCGLERYQSRAFGLEYQDNLFACLFNMHKITRHVLTPDGATFKSRDEDFLVSNNLDFHPTDILEDADGSLIVVDTGGWYKLCCPTSQLHKPDILGSIYRVRRKDASRIADPRGTKLAWPKMAPAELARLLADERPAVRTGAIHELGKRGPDAIATLKPLVSAGGVRVPRNESGRQSTGMAVGVRLGAIWALTRIDDRAARAAVRNALSDPSEIVRQAAIHSVSVNRDGDAVPQLKHLLENGAPANRRAAAEAIGRIGDMSAVAALLSATSGKGEQDRALEHSLTFALIEIADPAATAAGLKGPNAQTRRAALVALSEMDRGGLQPETVAPLLTSADPMLKETAAWIVSRHADWGGALAGYLRDRLATPDLSEADRSELTRQLARFAGNPAIQELLADAASIHSPPTPTRSASEGQARVIALQAIRSSGLKEKDVPKAWVEALVAVLGSGDVELLGDAIAAARVLPVPKDHAPILSAALLKIARNSDTPAQVRLGAMAAIPGGVAAVEPEAFELLRASLAPDSPAGVRSGAAEVVSKSRLTPSQLASLTDLIRTAGPLEVDRLLTPFAQCSDESVGLKLVATLKESPSLTAMRVDSLKTHLAKFGAPVQDQAQQLYAAINVDLAKQKERLEELLSSLAQGDIRRGQAVFMGQKAACSTCHAMGYLGGKVGPDLTRIGGIRNERDLLESIAFPSASFVRSYESVVVATQDGKIHSGILRKDAPDEVVLAINATEEVRIAREAIEEIRPGSVSVMPSGLDQQLTPPELSDLIAFLKTAK